jgi:hypothetical protein
MQANTTEFFTIEWSDGYGSGMIFGCFYIGDDPEGNPGSEKENRNSNGSIHTHE